MIDGCTNPNGHEFDEDYYGWLTCRHCGVIWPPWAFDDPDSSGPGESGAPLLADEYDECDPEDVYDIEWDKNQVEVWTVGDLMAAKTVPEIAVEIGCHRNTVYYWCKKLGIQRKTRDYFLRPEQVAFLKSHIKPREVRHE